MSMPTSVLLFGHSFVLRLRHHMADPVNYKSWDLGQDVHTDVYGVGGMKLHQVSDHYYLFSAIQPDIVILELGTNDLASPNTDPITLAQEVYNLARLLREQFQVKIVFINQFSNAMLFI